MVADLLVQKFGHLVDLLQMEIFSWCHQYGIERLLRRSGRQNVCRVKFQRHAFEIKELAMFIFDADSYAIYMGVCRTVAQHLLRGRIVAYLDIKQAFYVKSNQNI